MKIRATASKPRELRVGRQNDCKGGWVGALGAVWAARWRRQTRRQDGRLERGRTPPVADRSYYFTTVGLALFLSFPPSVASYSDCLPLPPLASPSLPPSLSPKPAGNAARPPPPSIPPPTSLPSPPSTNTTVTTDPSISLTAAPSHHPPAPSPSPSPSPYPPVPFPSPSLPPYPPPPPPPHPQNCSTGS